MSDLQNAQYVMPQAVGHGESRRVPWQAQPS